MGNFGGFGNDDDGFVPTGAPVFAVVSAAAVSIGVGEASYAEPLLLLGDAWSEPSSAGFAGGFLYVDNGQLHYLGQLGTITFIAGTPLVREADGLFLADSVVLAGDRTIMVDDGVLLDDLTDLVGGPGFVREYLALVDLAIIDVQIDMVLTDEILLGETPAVLGDGMLTQSDDNMLTQSGDNMIPQSG